MALVLGGLAEEALRQSLIMGDGSAAIFFSRPLSAVIFVIVLFLFALPAIRMGTGRARVVSARMTHS